jgi:uncharacterized protein
MPIFDIHTHLGRLLQDLPFNTPESLVAILDREQIDRAAVMAVGNPGEGDYFYTTWQVLEACAHFPDRLVPFCNTDPRHRYPDSFNPYPVLAEYAERGCRGFGEILADVAIDHPGLQKIYAACGELSLPVLFHADDTICYDEPGLPRLEAMLKKFPGTVFIGHAVHFWAEISAVQSAAEYARGVYFKGPVRRGGATDRLLGEYPNLYGDLSAGSGFNALNRDPDFGLEFLERRQDKLVFGTDVLHPHMPLPLVGFLRAAPISDLAREKILWGNAARLLRL